MTHLGCVPREHIELHLLMLQQWCMCYRREDTYAHREWGVPSVIVRFDYAAGSPDKPYELDDSPNGLGLASELCPGFAERVHEVLYGCSQAAGLPVRFFLSPQRAEAGNSDDELFVARHGVGIELDRGSILVDPCSQIWWPRTNPGEAREYPHVVRQALRPVATEGDKGYGLGMGWWDLCPPLAPGLCAGDIDSGDARVWVEGAVPAGAAGAAFKYSGARCEGVEIYTRQRQSGSATATKIVRHIRDAREQGLPVYRQSFVAPTTSTLPGLEGWPEVWRVYYGHDPIHNQWSCLGGLCVARPHGQIKLHGARDAVTWPLIPAEGGG